MSISNLTKSFPKKRFTPHLLTLILLGLCQFAAEAIDLPMAIPDDDDKRYGIGEDFDPTSPGNPESDEWSTKGETHRLILVTDPVVAGEAYAESYDLSAGAKTYVVTFGYHGFIFKNWTIEGSEVSAEAGFFYEMPDHDVTLVANYVFDPASPENPTIEEQIKIHPVTLRAIPFVAASFYGSDRFQMQENSTCQVNVYPNPGWSFTKWTINGEDQDETSTSLSVTMGDKALDIVAYFTFDPQSPSNPEGNEVQFLQAASGRVMVAFEGDMLHINGIASDEIDYVDVYDLNGQKLLHAPQVSESGIRTSMLSDGVYVVIVSGNGHHTYHKVAKK